MGFNVPRSKAKDTDCECATALVNDNEDEDEISNDCKRRLRQYEPSKKMYLLFFVSTTVVACFCIFVVIPQLIDYFTSPNAVLHIDNEVYDTEKQSVIDLLDTERIRRNQERLEIMKKFESLQENYKLLQIEYQKAQELYLKKLRSAIEKEEKSETTTPTSDMHFEIELNDETTNDNKIEKTFNTELPTSTAIVP